MWDRDLGAPEARRTSQTLILMPSLQTQAEAIAASYIPPATGRPSDIGDAHLLHELFEAVRAGNYFETACDLVGLSPAAAYNWKKRGEAGEEPYKRFVDTLKRASAQAEAVAVANVRKAGQSPQFWAAEMTYLERRHPEKWGRRQDSEGGPKVVVQVGGSATDVKVLISGVGEVSPPTFASLAPSCSTPNPLETQAFAEPSSPITALMVTQPEAEKKAQPARRRAKALRATRAHGSPVGTGVEAVVPTDNFPPVKGGR